MNKRNPFVSFILSFVIPGLGQMYNGELRKGLLFLFVILPILFLFGMTGITSSFKGLMIMLCVILIYKLGVSVEAFLRSRKLTDYDLKPINTPWKYILFAILGYAFIMFSSLSMRGLLGYESFVIPTVSMEPSIALGDRVWASQINPEEIELGEIISFKREDGLKYLCRVVALADQDIIISEDKVLYNNGSEEWTETKESHDENFEYQDYICKTPYDKSFEVKKLIKYRQNSYSPKKNTKTDTISVPTNSVFVMGDNRLNSMDSRMYGAVPYSDIDKKVNYVWWSKDLSRIGMKLD